MNNFLKNKAVRNTTAALITAAACAAALMCGRYRVSLPEILGIFTGGRIGAAEVSDTARQVILNIRMPRIIGALVCGAGLAVSGAGFQAVFSNALAAGDTLGVGTAASFGAVLALMLDFSSAGVHMAATAAGIASVFLVYIIAGRKGGTASLMLILSGMVVSALFSSMTAFIKYTADPQDKLPTITYWLMGNLKNMDWKTLGGGVFIITVGSGVIYMLRWKLDALALGEDEAAILGVPVKMLRGLVIFFSSCITAAVVSMCGQIGWIGLLIPHMARLVFGGSSRNVVPWSIVFGAWFLLAVDTAARCLTAAEIPAAVLTSLIGAPVFILLLRRAGGIHEN